VTKFGSTNPWDARAFARIADAGTDEGSGITRLARSPWGARLVWGGTAAGMLMLGGWRASEPVAMASLGTPFQQEFPMRQLFTVTTAACLAATSIAHAAGQCAIFARKTDTVRIAGNTTPASDFTVEWSGYPLAQSVTLGPAGFNARVWSEQDSGTEDKGIGINPNRTPTGGVNNGCFQYLSGTSPLAQLQAVHVALVHRSGNDSLYVNGLLVQSVASCSVFNGAGSNMSLGAFVYVGQSASNFWGAAPVALDWIRISTNARYTGAFTPPSEASLVADAATQLLLTFEGASPWTDRSSQQCVLSPGVGVTGGTVPAISTDCNSNGIPDEVEISAPGSDSNSNGVLDICECAQNPSLPPCCPGDINGDHVVNGADVGVLLAYWGNVTGNTPASVDLNRDGVALGSLSLISATRASGRPAPRRCLLTAARCHFCAGLLALPSSHASGGPLPKHARDLDRQPAHADRPGRRRAHRRRPQRAP
jgi:hypothetical protein